MALRRVLFVCTGNTCRGVLAEYLGRRFAGEAFEFESAGTRPQPAIDAANAVQTLRETFNIDASRHRPRDVRSLDLHVFDLIIAIRDPSPPGSQPVAQDDPAVVAKQLGVPEAKLQVWTVSDPWGPDPAEYDRAALDLRRKLAALKRQS